MKQNELAPYLDKAIQQYKDFFHTSCPMEAKEFSAYHSACKMALLHIALLEKLSQNQTEPSTKTPDLFSLIQRAKEDLKDENDFPGIRLDLE